MRHGAVESDRRLRLLGVCSLGLATSLYAVGLHLTAAFVVVVGACLVICVITLRLYRPGAEPAGLARQWEFSPQALGGFSYWQLTLVSSFGLFLELLMIRWVSSEINVFAYFKNFVLISCFLGFGLGCYMPHRRVQLMALLLPLFALAFVCTFPWSALRRLANILPNVVGASSQVEIWGWPTLRPDGLTLLLFAGAVIFIVLLFALIALVFVPIGQLVGWYLEHASNGILAGC